MFSRAAEYGIQALLYIAAAPSRGYILVKEIASVLELSPYFLGKILQTLVKAGILESYRGPNGGFVLGRPAEEISLLEVVEAIDGVELFTKLCVIGLPECSDDNPCPIHKDWRTVRAGIIEMLVGKSVATLLTEWKAMDNSFWNVWEKNALKLRTSAAKSKT